MISIRYEEQEGGHTVTVSPKERLLKFRPFGFNDFRGFYLRKEPLRFTIDDASIDVEGPIHSNRGVVGSVSFQLEPRGRAMEYAVLVPNGWLPARVAQIEFLLLDSNIAKNLGNFKSSMNEAVPSACDALNIETVVLSPVLAAIEGNKKHFGSLGELEVHMKEVAAKIERRFPGRTLPIADAQVVAAYNLAEENRSRWPRQKDFLSRFWPLLQGRKRKSHSADARLHEAVKVIKESGVSPNSCLTVLALNALFAPNQAVQHAVPGEALLKPDQPASDAHFYNVLSDVWAIELALKTYASFGPNKAAVCTNDRGMVGAWALLRPSNFTTKPDGKGSVSANYSVSLDRNFAETLSEPLFEKLCAELGWGNI